MGKRPDAGASVRIPRGLSSSRLVVEGKDGIVMEMRVQNDGISLAIFWSG